MDEKKEKCAYWMRPSMVSEIEEMVPDANVKSKSEFVCKAVEFYIGYLRSQKNMNFLAPILTSAVRSEIRSAENHICEMLYRIAVEQAMNSHLIAAFNDVSGSNIQQLRDLCSQTVAENNGIITFEDADEFQNGAV